MAMRKVTQVQLFEPRISITVLKDDEPLEGTQKGYDLAGLDVAVLARFLGLKTHDPIFAWTGDDGVQRERRMEDHVFTVYPTKYDTWNVSNVQAEEKDGTLHLLVQWAADDKEDLTSYTYCGKYMIQWADRSWEI